MASQYSVVSPSGLSSASSRCSSTFSDASTAPSTHSSFSTTHDFEDAPKYLHPPPMIQASGSSFCYAASNRPIAMIQRSKTVPTPARQPDKALFVDSLVESATLIVETVWPKSAVTPCQHSSKPPLPLRTFIEETLRRSRTSYSTLQVAMFYLLLIKAHVPKSDDEVTSSNGALRCGRRMFLVALILASKYLQDRNYSAKAWSKMSGLPISEINNNEICFLKAINWQLHIPETRFNEWTTFGHKFPPPPSASTAHFLMNGHVMGQVQIWKQRIQSLDPMTMKYEEPIPPPCVSPSTPMYRSARSPVLPIPTATASVPALKRHLTQPMLRRAADAMVPSMVSLSGSLSELPLSGQNALSTMQDNMSFPTAGRVLDRCPYTHSPYSVMPRKPSLLSNGSTPQSMVSDDSRSSPSSVASTVLPLSQVYTVPGISKEEVSPKRSFGMLTSSPAQFDYTSATSFYQSGTKRPRSCVESEPSEETLRGPQREIGRQMYMYSGSGWNKRSRLEGRPIASVA